MKADRQSPNSSQILAARTARNDIDVQRPYHFLVEPEMSASGQVVDVATIFLTNKECPFRCLMCDLWKNTTQSTAPLGAIPRQIQYALERLPPAREIKLYNSGNFFDPAAYPVADRQQVAGLLSSFDRIVVENHPRLCNQSVLEFQSMLSGQLEVAMGLETSHPETLARLNKQMTVDDFAAASEFLRTAGIEIRTFVLLKPPWTTEEEGIDRASESVRFAFRNGASCCAVIPTRSGNGIMDILEQQGHFSSPSLQSLETVIDEALGWKTGRVFADLWDLVRFSECSVCFADRLERLDRENLRQAILPPVECHACGDKKGASNGTS